MNSFIVSTINSKSLLSFNYHGVRRVVEPHTYGCDNNHVDKLSAWQISGKPQDNPDWRIYEIVDMQMLQVLDQHFASARQGYKRNDNRMKTIYAQL